MIVPRRIAPDHPHALSLTAAMAAEVVAMYGPPDPSWVAAAAPDGLAAYVALYDDEEGAAVAGGALKPLEPGMVEIKRMYVVPELRGRGLAGQLLEGLEDAARDLGAAIVRLDTGPNQSHAERLYRRAGYVPVPDYNGNRYASFWGEKKL